jgi:hypothetical protein
MFSKIPENTSRVVTGLGILVAKASVFPQILTHEPKDNGALSAVETPF